MSCLPCSKVSSNEHDVIDYYKNLFKKHKKVYWAYRLNRKDTFSFVENSYFAKIRVNLIEPNFKNGAEYFHISEFKG